MANTRNDGLITAIDIGSWKVSALIARKTENGGLAVLGTGQRESRGVRRGFVVDMERTEAAVRETVEQAEKVAGTNIEKVILSFSAGSVESKVEPVETVIGGRAIAQQDVDALFERARDRIDPQGHRVMLQAQPTLYTIDGVRGVARPLGLHAERLSVDVHVVLAEGAPLRNLETAVRGAYLDVDTVVAAPIATAAACLSDEDRDLGVALVELGAGVTNVSLHIGGMLVGLRSIPIGASDITDDIASAFGIRRSQAERMKCFYGSAMQNRRDYRDVIEIAPVASADNAEPRKITRAELVGVICERLGRLMKEVSVALDEMGFHSPVGRQVVLTGGGADLKGIADYAQTTLGRAVRIGKPRVIEGLPDAHRGPAFATLTGLALHAASDRVDLLHSPAPQTLASKMRWSDAARRLITTLRSAY
jgi:cell division protein FtsA